MHSNGSIEEYFRTGYGIRLQFLDSQIAEQVMLDLMLRRIPVLPVHDSFIVRTANRGNLIESMVNIYQRLVGATPNTSISQTVLDLIEERETPHDFEELVQSNLRMLEDLRLNGNQEYSSYETYQVDGITYTGNI